jgi:hypothetical protein
LTDLNNLYKTQPALHEKQFSPEGLNGLIIRIIKMLYLLEKEMIQK